MLRLDRIAGRSVTDALASRYLVECQLLVLGPSLVRNDFRRRELADRELGS